MIEKLLTDQHVRKNIFDVSAATWHRMGKKGERPPCLVINGRRYFRPEDLCKWLEGRKRGAPKNAEVDA
jgi:hypothetical protein